MTVHDFGTVKQHSTNKYIFQFTNTGTQPLVINTAMFYLTSWIGGFFGYGMFIENFAQYEAHVGDEVMAAAPKAA